MTAENLARHRTDPNIGFWRQLKEGSDRFEATGKEPVVSVVDGRYAFAPIRDVAEEAAATARRAIEDARIAGLVADGVAAVRTTYADGGQHPYFAGLLRRGANLGDVSRPEALAFAGHEITLIPARPKPVLVAALPPPRMPASSGWSEPSVFAANAIGALPPEAVLGQALAGSAAIVAPAMMPVGASRAREAGLVTDAPARMAAAVEPRR